MGVTAVVVVTAAAVTRPAFAGSTVNHQAETPSQVASRTGKRVEVIDQRTPTSTTWANPDGTFSLDLSAAPVRGRAADGSWKPVDLTLEKRADGSIRPRVSGVDVRFSAGGSGPLVTLVEKGLTFRLGVPDGIRKKLRPPTLSGAAATYSSVLTGVDLVLTAVEDGYRLVLVVKSAAAAAAVKSVKFPLGAPGLNVRATGRGGLQALDGDANAVFTTPPVRMWDSSAASVKSAARAVSSSSAVSVVRQDGESPNPAVAPPPGSREAAVAVDVTGNNRVSVRPDSSFLAGRTTRYPVYINMRSSLPGPDWMMLSTLGENVWHWGKGAKGEAVGFCSDKWVGCRNQKKRLLFSFARSPLIGKTVWDANFRITQTWSVTCKSSVIALYRGGKAFNAEVEWGTQPPLKELLADRTVSAGQGDRCGPKQPDLNVSFSDRDAVNGEAANLTSTIARFGDGTLGTRLYLTLLAGDESDATSWKRFKNDAVLSVTYVARPVAPVAVGVAPDSSTTPACPKKPDDSMTLNEEFPIVQAQPTLAVRPAKGEDRGALRVLLQVELKNAAGTGWDAVWTDDRPESGTVTVDDTQRATVNKLSDGGQYRLHALTRSYYGSTFIESKWSDYCYFHGDMTAPKPPAITSAD